MQQINSVRVTERRTTAYNKRFAAGLADGIIIGLLYYYQLISGLTEFYSAFSY